MLQNSLVSISFEFIKRQSSQPTMWTVSHYIFFSMGFHCFLYRCILRNLSVVSYCPFGILQRGHILTENRRLCARYHKRSCVSLRPYLYLWASPAKFQHHGIFRMVTKQQDITLFVWIQFFIGLFILLLDKMKLKKRYSSFKQHNIRRSLCINRKKLTLAIVWH